MNSKILLVLELSLLDLSLFGVWLGLRYLVDFWIINSFWVGVFAITTVILAQLELIREQNMREGRAFRGTPKVDPF